MRACRIDFVRYGLVRGVIRDNRTRRETEVLPSLEDIRELWRTFGDVQVDPATECLDEAFLKFPVGTHREEVWRWFEETYHVSVAEDLMGMDK